MENGHFLWAFLTPPELSWWSHFICYPFSVRMETMDLTLQLSELNPPTHLETHFISLYVDIPGGLIHQSNSFTTCFNVSSATIQDAQLMKLEKCMKSFLSLLPYIPALSLPFAFRINNFSMVLSWLHVSLMKVLNIGMCSVLIKHRAHEEIKPILLFRKIIPHKTQCWSIMIFNHINETKC